MRAIVWVLVAVSTLTGCASTTPSCRPGIVVKTIRPDPPPAALLEPPKPPVLLQNGM